MARLKTSLKKDNISQTDQRPNLLEIPLKTRFSRLSTTPLIINYRNVEYFINLRMGSNKSEFDVLLDPKTSDFWLPSHNCRGCKQETRFHCGLSSTCFTDFSEALKSMYTEGPVEGYIAYDQLSLDPGLHIPRQSFVLLSSCSGHIADVNGVLGLSYTIPGINKNPSVLTNLASSGQIKSPIFSFNIKIDSDKKPNHLILGGIQSSLIKKDYELYWVGLHNPRSLRVKYNKIKLDSTTLQTWPGEALLDTTNSFLTLPRLVIKQIRNYLEHRHNITCYFYKESFAQLFSMMNCFLDASSKEFPTIGISIDGGFFPLEPKDYIYECKSNTKNATIKCNTMFELSEKQDHLTLGMSFHSTFYVVYDLDKKRVGIAPSVVNNTFRVFDDQFKLVGNATSLKEMMFILGNVYPTPTPRFTPHHSDILIYDASQGQHRPPHIIRSGTENEETSQANKEEKLDTSFNTYQIVVIVLAVPIAIIIIALGIILYKVITRNLSKMEKSRTGSPPVDVSGNPGI
jgi:hypothetical protein